MQRCRVMGRPGVLRQWWKVSVVGALQTTPLSCDFKILYLHSAHNSCKYFWRITVFVFLMMLQMHQWWVYVGTVNELLTSQMSVYLSFCHLRLPIVENPVDYSEVIINRQLWLIDTYHVPGTRSVLCTHYLESLQQPCEFDISPCLVES